MSDSFGTFTSAYEQLFVDVFDRPDFEPAPRGMRVKEVLCKSFTLEDPLDRLPYVAARGFYASYFVAESLFYLAALDSTEWIANYAPFWRDITDDGKTATSAYGARIFRPHSRIASDVDPTWTQWQYVKDELLRDPDSRRAVVHIRSPHDSILAKKDVPCTLTLQFFLRDDLLHLVVSMRSSDLVLGLAYDVPAFTLIQEYMALQLTNDFGRPIGLGQYHHVSNSLHLYERHFEMAREVCDDLYKERFSSFRARRATIPKKMPAMTLPVPIEKLLWVEDRFRKSMTETELERVINTAGSFDSDYWWDWVTILASHRARKLKASGLSSDLVNSLTFDGYKFFKR